MQVTEHGLSRERVVFHMGMTGSRDGSLDRASQGGPSDEKVKAAVLERPILPRYDMPCAIELRRSVND